MLPNFKSGQIVLARKTRCLSVNDVVVIKTHDNSQIIKRISNIKDKEIIMPSCLIQINELQIKIIDNIFKFSLFLFLRVRLYK